MEMRKAILPLLLLVALTALAGCEGLGRGVYEGTQMRDRTGVQDRDAKPTVEQQPTYDQYREGTKQ
jgi:hypothetical protein